MKLKFYATIFSLFVMISVSEAQYSIWKPVTKNPLMSSDKFGYYTSFSAASDSNSVYFTIKSSPMNFFYIVKCDKNGDVTIDSTFSTNSPFPNYNELNSPFAYHSKLYMYAKGSQTKDDTVYNTIYRIDSIEKYVPIVNRQVNLAGRPTIINDVITYKDEIYTIGDMKEIDSVKCHLIAKYNGAKWTSLGAGNDMLFPDNVYPVSNSFKIYNDKLYILAKAMDTNTGNFLSNFLACWDGQKWLFKKSLPDSIEQFEALYTINNKLYGLTYSPLTLYQIDDSIIHSQPIVFDNIFCRNVSNINNQLWVESLSKDFYIVDTASASIVSAYYRDPCNSSYYSNYTLFNNKIFCYGTGDFLADNDTFRYIAQTDKLPIKISGQVIYDKDSNCKLDIEDHLGSNNMIKVSPGPRYLSADSNGKYDLVVAADSINVEFLTKDRWKVNSCSSNKYTISQNDGLDHSHLNFFTGIASQAHDLSTKIIGSTGWRARRGFTEQYVLSVKNEGTEKDSGKVRLYYNNKFEIKNANPAADSLTNTWAEWTVPSLDLFGQLNIYIDANIDTAIHNEDTMVLSSQVFLPIDANIYDNTDTLSQIIVSSFDPNVIVAFPQGNDSINFVFPTHKQLEYLIHFQNDGTDTAYNISVIDTLGENLDVSKFEIISSSHKMDYKILPYDQQTNKHFIKFNFDNILLAPTDSNNKNQTDNGGFVSYKIQLKNNLPIGTEIPNRAYIFFDYNSAVETNTAIVRIDTTIANGITQPQRFMGEQTIHYWPVPSNDKLFVMNLLNEKQQLEVYNIEGKKLMMHSINGNETSTISLENLPQGMYFLRSFSNAGKIYKFIKN